MKIAKDSVVSIDYRLHLGDGNTVDASKEGAPLVYLQGHGQIVPGLERALEGCGVGEVKSVAVPPAQGYGEHDPEGVQEVPRERFPEGMVPKEGAVLSATTPEGDEVPFVVKEVRPQTVVVDLNHPLAGKTLHFDVTVREVRQATADELSHGHAHGPGGAHS
jgi:FKBP-type peptidyl-prolyl cis-trans isomerase SlyD